MDHVFPEGIIVRTVADAPQQVRYDRAREDVVAGGIRLPLLALSDTGFVVRAEVRPRLRGFVDIMQGGTRLARRLVVCAWAEDGMIGYEFKSGGPARPIAPDYVPDGSAPD